MSVRFFNEDVPLPKIKRRIITSWINETIASEGQFSGDINFIFCSDNYLLDVNRKYLNHDYFTDIITFDYVLENIISGDVFVSIERVRENAKQYQVPVLNELNRIMIHGVLHLLGFKDKKATDKKVMTAKEDFYLNVLAEKFLK